MWEQGKGGVLDAPRAPVSVAMPDVSPGRTRWGGDGVEVGIGDPLLEKLGLLHLQHGMDLAGWLVPRLLHTEERVTLPSCQ